MDREKVVALGGSHGGYLVSQLIGQYPVCTANNLFNNLYFLNNIAIFSLKCYISNILFLSQNFYKAAVMRNPVTNLVAMVTQSDIPDW